MRKVLVAGILSAAVAGAGLFEPGHGWAQPAKPADQKKADAKVKDAAIPVRQVVLYSSGVGYFEHFGTVEGDGTTELQFKTQQINDILKSLVLQDMDKGKVGVITYPSQDPIAKLLRSFQIDIANNPGMYELLAQLRGAKVQISLGAEEISGTVLGVEKKPRPVGDDKSGEVVEVGFVNLITDSGIRSVSLDEIRTLQLQDAKLREELQRALAALSEARDQDKKPVRINLQGQGERRIRIGYVVETPVWKTSYRLILSDKAGGGAAADKAAVDLGGKPGGAKAGGDQGKAGGTGTLQGWAIVENQTDNDWNDVQLSLVSGRPISFVMDLYQPLYIPRPVVQPQLYASLRPQTYDAGIQDRKRVEEFAERDRSDGTPLVRQRELKAESLERLAAKPGDAGGRFAGSGVGMEPMDPGQSIASVASAAKVGELFQYTVGNVTLPRQTSAMIPVVTDPVEVEKLSIYNVNVLQKHPLLGARVGNTTGKHLLQGPITVLDESAYAGDARIDDVPPGQERLISYGIDQQILVDSSNSRNDSSVISGKIVKGVLQLSVKSVNWREYVADNKADKAKTLLIEHPRLGGAWKLVEPEKADETTDDLYRFKGTVGAGKATKLKVTQELVNLQEIAVLPMDPGDIAVYVRTETIPQEVRAALTKVIEMKQAVVETQRQINELQQQIKQISQEQDRLRENMKTVALNTEYYNRLLKKLDDQESRIEDLQKQIEALRTKEQKQRESLSDFLAGLNVG